MLLSKDGITFDVLHPVEIKRFKALGYVEETPAASDPLKAEKPKSEKKSEKKEGE